MVRIIILVIFFIPLLASGEQRAILKSSQELGIQLSVKAQENIGIKTTAFKNSKNLLIPKKAIVYSMDKIGIYRMRDSWFKFIQIEIISKEGSNFIIKTAELKLGDYVVIDGVPLLRVSEMEAFTKED
jgi:hypothetical protein